MKTNCLSAFICVYRRPILLLCHDYEAALSHSPPGSAAATPLSRPAPPARLAALAIAVLLHQYAGFAPWHFLLLAAAPLHPRHLGRQPSPPRSKNSKIPQIVVVDEVLGQWIALAGARTLNWKSYLAAFALFRLFDIWKPPPVRQLEALPGGCGINLRRRHGRRLCAHLCYSLAGWFNLY